VYLNEEPRRMSVSPATSPHPGFSETGSTAIAGIGSGLVVVTGANGHLGGMLLRRLVSRGEAGSRVRALVRSSAAAEAVSKSGSSDAVECRIVDYSDVDGIARACEGATHLVHLVGILKQTAWTRYTDAHETSVTALTRAAEKVGLRRIVYPSILGARPDASNACLASKGRAEEILLTRNRSATVIRLPMVLGAGDHATAALRARATAGFVPLIRGGATLEQPIDARDVIEGILLALSRRELANTALDLAGPESLSQRDLVLRAAALYGRTPRIIPIPLVLVRSFAAVAERILANPPLTRAMLDVLEQNDRIDPAPACEQLGLRLTPLDETLRRTVGPGTEAA
jgi:uncharacterized protein YbjT (DUF2867 family)